MTHTVAAPSPTEWDAFVKSQLGAHILQMSGWGELKSAFGWTVERVALTGDEGAIQAGAQILYRALPFRLGQMAYVGMGPYVRDAEQWKELWASIDHAARAQGAAFLKWEPGLTETAAMDPARSGFRPSPQTVQPPRTIVVDIGGDEEAILARMNQGTRRKIRQSLKNGIRYYEGDRADIQVFTEMMRITGTRNAFGVHEPAYYARAYDLFVPDQAALILAEHEGDHLAGIMVFACGATAWYLYGASTDVKRNLMAAYGVQWAAIQWARQRGCSRYDMWGIPDEDEAVLEAQFEQRSDGLWGVYGFKRGWGGKVVRSAGAWDRVYRPAIYELYRLALRLRGE